MTSHGVRYQSAATNATDPQPPSDERHLVMIFKDTRRRLADGCFQCGASLVLCCSFADMERERCCSGCAHPD